MAKLNQQLIAERLNLSRTTVSRCFTNHPKISPETRAKVFQLAAEMGYDYTAQRNQNRETKGDERNVIAVLIGLPQGQVVDTASHILAGISEKTASERLELQLHYVDPTTFMPSPRPRKIIKNVNTASWRGVLLLYPLQEQAVRNLMTKFPTLSVLDEYDFPEVDCVDADQVHGIRLMVQHLHQLGHRRIGFLTWKYQVPAAWVERRFGAYVESLYRFNLPFNPSDVLNTQADERIPLPELTRLAAERTRDGVTAWVCAADHQAYHLIDGLQEMGLRVPEDVSVTGFDGVPPPIGMPQLTTIRVAFRDIGVSAVHSLQRKIMDSAAQRRHVLVMGKEVPGATTAPPAR
ncbi:MAG: hypothetical protein E1N59_519 [Puniceicoccaceae bacterium 5H]|nr:MAG: hypothetical protein E1N59_519 [Puniceicoccaceae bacterium 5H]